ncbi:MAG TPA: LacI family transcriptional regulator [Firmicutes bacterium]|nr:LacI family transcriptional regulator [Bacillota bacterium]
MARATLIDIARKAGVSRTTVSYVLNNKADARISPETRERILQAKMELDYQPNLVARSLRTRCTQTIGVMVGNMIVKNFMLAVAGIQKAAFRHHYHVLLADTQGRNESYIEHIKLLSQKNVDGLIIITATRYIDSKLPEFLAQLSIPTVFVNRPYSEEGTPLPVPTVYVDFEKAMYDAVQYLIGLGHKAIGFAGANMQNLSVKIRRDGYVKAMSQAELAIDPGWMVAEPEGLSTYAFGMKSAPKLIGKGVTAIVTVNDEVAAGVMHYAQQQGIKVPGQLSVIGHDNLDTVKYIQPRLTTVQHPSQEAGVMAFEMLLELMGDPEWKSKAEKALALYSTVLIRDSTDAPPA